MRRNRVASILFFCGISVMIIGLIFGIANGVTDEVVVDTIHDEADNGEVLTSQTFDFVSFIITLFGAFLFGMLFIGLSEIIILLQKIQKGIGPEKYVVERSEMPALKENKESLVSANDKEKIEALFPNGEVEILPTPYNSICVVVFQHDVADVVKVMDVAGFKAKEVQDKEIVEEVMNWYHKHIK